jgi:hypothetical protein
LELREEINYAFDKFKIKKLMPETEGKLQEGLELAAVSAFIFYSYSIADQSEISNDIFIFFFSKFFFIKIKLLFCF